MPPSRALDAASPCPSAASELRSLPGEQPVAKFVEPDHRLLGVAPRSPDQLVRQKAGQEVGTWAPRSPFAKAPEWPRLLALRASREPTPPQPPPPPHVGKWSGRALHGPHGPSGLRWSLGCGPSLFEQLALGNAYFRHRPGETSAAVRLWLTTLLCGQSTQLVRQLSHLLDERMLPAQDCGLAWFHVACHEAGLERAKEAMNAALRLEPALEAVLLDLVEAARRDPRMRHAVGPLADLFSAPRSVCARSQVHLVELAKAGSWQRVSELADTLVANHPQLLAPQCLQFVGALRALAPEDVDDVDDLEACFRLVDLAHDLLAFARGLDAEGHRLCVGASPKSAVRWAWQTFLVEATNRGFLDFDGAGATNAAIGAAGPPCAKAPAANRRLAGLPWERALRLPLKRPWQAEAARHAGPVP